MIKFSMAPGNRISRNTNLESVLTILIQKYIFVKNKLNDRSIHYQKNLLKFISV